MLFNVGTYLSKGTGNEGERVLPNSMDTENSISPYLKKRLHLQLALILPVLRSCIHLYQGQTSSISAYR